MKHSKLLALVMAIAMIVSMVVTTGVTTVSAEDAVIAPNPTSAEEDPVAGLDVITLDFSRDGNWSACGIKHPEYGVAFYNNYRQSDDGKSVEVHYQDPTERGNYTLSPCFKKGADVQYDTEYQYVRILYSAKVPSKGATDLTMYNNSGKSPKVTLVEEVKDTNGKFVLSDTAKINDGMAERFAKNNWCAIQLGFKNMSDDGMFAVKAIYFFKTASEANKAGFASDKIAEALKMKKKIELLQTLVFLVGKNKPVEPEEPWVPEDCVVLKFGSDGTGRLTMDERDKDTGIPYDQPTLVDDYYVLDSTNAYANVYSGKPVFNKPIPYTTEYKFVRVLYAADMPKTVGTIRMRATNGPQSSYDVLVEEVLNTSGGFVLSDTAELNPDALNSHTGLVDNFATRLAKNESNFIRFEISEPGCTFKIKALYFFKTKEAADAMYDVIPMTFDTDEKAGNGTITVPSNEGTAPVLDTTDGSYSVSGAPNLTFQYLNNYYGFKPNFTSEYLTENPFDTKFRYVRVAYSAEVPEGTPSFRFSFYCGSGAENVTLATIKGSTNGYVVSAPVQLAKAGSGKTIIDMIKERGSNFLVFRTSQPGCTFKIQGIYFFKTLQAAEGFETIYDPNVKIVEPPAPNEWYTYYFGTEGDYNAPADPCKFAETKEDGVREALVSDNVADGYAVHQESDAVVLYYLSDYACKDGTDTVVNTSGGAVDGIYPPLYKAASRYYTRIDSGLNYDTSYKWLVVEYAASMPADTSTTLVVGRGDGGGVANGKAIANNVVDTNGEFVMTAPVNLGDTTKFPVIGDKDWPTRFDVGEIILAFKTAETGRQFKIKALYFFKTEEAANEFSGIVVEDIVTMDFKPTTGNAAWRTQSDWGYAEYTDNALLVKCGGIHANRAEALKYYWPFYEYITGQTRPETVPNWLPEFVADPTSEKGYKMRVDADPAKNLTINGLTYRCVNGNGYGNGNWTTLINDFFLNFDPEACGCVVDGKIDASKIIPGNAKGTNTQIPGTNAVDTTMMAKIHFKEKRTDLAAGTYPYVRIVYELKLPAGVDSANIIIANDAGGSVTAVKDAKNTSGYVLSDAIKLDDKLIARFAQPNHASLKVLTKVVDSNAYLKVKGFYFVKDDATIPSAAAEYAQKK